MQSSDKLISHTLQPSAGVGSWLTYTESLTDRLFMATGNVTLDLLSQGWVQSTAHDHYFLAIEDHDVLQREIMMKSYKTPYWYARTVIPRSSYDKNPDFFKRLENESVRNLVFDKAHVRRNQLIHYPITKDAVEYSWVLNHLPHVCGTIWVRCCDYVLQDSAVFYLFELLLPEIELLACE